MNIHNLREEFLQILKKENKKSRFLPNFCSFLHFLNYGTSTISIFGVKCKDKTGETAFFSNMDWGRVFVVEGKVSSFT